MRSRNAFTAAILAAAAAGVLSGCQTVAPAAESCTVSAADIEAVQSQYRARFETVTQNPDGFDAAKKNAPHLGSPFEAAVIETLSVHSTDQPAASVNYAWTVNLREGCLLDAKLGTSTTSTGKDLPPVRAIAFDGKKHADGRSYFEPLQIIISRTNK